MAVLKDYYNGSTDTQFGLYGDNWVAQTLTATATYNCGRIKLKLLNSGAGAIDFCVSLYNTTAGEPSGSALATGTQTASDFTDDAAGDWYNFDFSTSVSIVSGTVYAIVAYLDGGNASDDVKWRAKGDSSYTTGATFTSDDAGGSWSSPGTYDCGFETYLIGQVDEKFYSNSLVAIGKEELWYESTAGTMAELTAANGELDTDDPLSAVEAYQKIFVVNRTNLKIADFGNTKLTTDDIKPTDKVIPLKGDTISGGTSAASMIVDYIDVTDGACSIYGFRTTTATFSDGETVTGTNNNGDISFTTSAAEVAPPHWYDWTVYSDDATTYGTMPTSSSLMALYRGRLVINDDNRPYAWYMTKVGNPWKVLYDYDNDGDLSAVVHSNNLVGEIGDVITALVPYKDDLLIFGCSYSIWVLVGDPLGSGQLARVSDKTGIWGAASWCVDEQANLYFLGEDGIYRMPISTSYSPPENLSKVTLPNLITDLALDKENHRVTLGYDPVRKGILICKTNLADGDNTNYWYSLITGGFYPEEYPDSCGVFSTYHYPATNASYRKFLLGCNDGYIREFDNSTKNDATTASTSAIDSYFAVTNKLSENEDMEGKLVWINGVTAGGAANGDFSDTDSVGYSLSTADDAETCLEDIKDGATAFATGTWNDTGKQTKNRVRMRGAWFGLKLRNNTASETWAINNIYINSEKAGKLR